MQTKPNLLFQILISDRAEQALQKTETLHRNVESFKATYPTARYRCYSNEELTEFIFGHFGEDVLKVYRSLTPYAFKADLARYCLLYVHGGLYSDLAYLHTRAINIDVAYEMIVFRDIPGHPSWSTSNALIYSEARNPILERAINRVAKHYAVQYYGHHPLDLSGPYMFGRILAETPDWTKVRFGDSVLLNVESTGRPNIVKVMPTGEVVAIRNKTLNNRITDLVVSGGNDYSELWTNREVWRSPSDGALQKVRSLIGSAIGSVTGPKI